MEGKREEESRRRGKCHRRAARLGLGAAEVAARRSADDDLRVSSDERIGGITVLEAVDEAGAAVAAHALAVVDVLALLATDVVAVVAPDMTTILDALFACVEYQVSRDTRHRRDA